MPVVCSGKVMGSEVNGLKATAGEASSRGILMLLGKAEWSESYSHHFNAFPWVTWTFHWVILPLEPWEQLPLTQDLCRIETASRTQTLQHVVFQLTVLAIFNTSSLSSRSWETIHSLNSPCPSLCPCQWNTAGLSSFPTTAHQPQPGVWILISCPLAWLSTRPCGPQEVWCPTFVLRWADRSLPLLAPHAGQRPGLKTLVSSNHSHGSGLTASENQGPHVSARTLPQGLP